MIDILKKRLNSTEVLENSIPLFIEAFVRYYGEEERENITNKFSNMLIIGYQQPQSVSNFLYEIYNQKSRELIDSILDKAQVDEDKREFFRSTLFNNTSFVYETIQPIYDYVNYINGNRVSSWDKSKVVTLLAKFYPDVTVDNLDEKIQRREFSLLDNIIPFYKEAVLEFREFKMGFKPYSDYVDKCESLKSELEKKYMLKCIYELKPVFLSRDFEAIEAIITSDSFSLFNNPIIKNYVGSSIISTPLIESFSSEHDELLLNGDEWRKDSVRRDRISFYKNLGLNLGDDYSSYENDPRAMELTPSKEVVNFVLEVKKQIYTEKMNEYYNNIPEHVKNSERMKACGLVSTHELCSPKDYTNQQTYISPRFSQKDGQYLLYPVLCLYSGSNTGELDHNIIHELNHIYELSLLSLNGNEYSAISGWDVVDGKVIEDDKQNVVSLEKDEEKRGYELFNEIINELIAQDICQIMVDMGAYVLTSKETNKYTGTTSYEHTMFLVREFYNTYKSEIIQSRKNGDMSVLFSAVGKENFNALNSLFHDFYESFSGFKVYKLFSDLNKGLVTENTTKYASLIERRDAILQSMNEVSKENKNIK